MPIPVIISNLGIPVRAVDRGAPEMQVSSNGLGIPIRLSDRGVPFVVLGLEPVGQPPVPQPAAQRTIIITDYAGDCDDAAAMAIACQAHRDGIINLLGVVASSNVATAASGVRGQLNAYGMQSIPVYAYQGSIGSYNNRLSAAVRDIFGVSGQLRDAFQDDVVGLRTLLAAAPNGSVKVIDIGAPVSGARLLDSPADGISPLTGMQLVAAKVSALYQMAGRFDADTTPEYNAAQDVASTRRVYQDWPTPVFAHGGELGRDIFSGPPAATDVLTDPVKAAFESYKSFDQLVNDKRHSWDPIAIDQGIYGNQSLYTQSAAGSIVVETDGRTVFTAGAGNRYVIGRAASATAIGAALDAKIAPIAVPTPSPRRKISRVYSLTEGTGTTTTPSAGSPMTLVGGATWRTGPVGVSLNGISGRMVAPATNDITLTNYLVCMVFRPAAINGIRQLYTMNEYDQRIGHMRLNAGRPELVTFNINTGQTLTAPTALAANTWAMGLWYVNDNQGIIRINGTQVAQNTMVRRNKALISGLEQAVGAEKNAFTFAFQNFFQGDVIAMEILSGAETTDFAAVETRMRDIASGKGVTLP